jgi:outer membrane protein assembly factor BamB
LADEMSAPIFGPDGTVYLLADARDSQDAYRQSVVALDQSGRVKAGWPFELPLESAFGWVRVGPDGSVYVEECGGPRVGCALHRLGTNGRELAGWPFIVPACPSSGTCWSSLLIGPDGTAYIASPDDGRLIAINASGKIKPGWPVSLDGHDGSWVDMELSSDGTLFVFTWPGGRENQASLAAFSPGGSLRPGWPVSIPGGYVLGPQGTVAVMWGIDDAGELCSDFRRTVFTVLGSDGRTLPGWPRGSKGSASRPVVGADGTVYYVSALGNVYAHDRSGEVKAGWPVSVPGVFPGCGFYGPYLAPDHTVYVLGDELAAMSPDGTGWRYRPEGSLGGFSCDTDGQNRPPPAFGPDGTVYVAVLAHSADSWEVVALDREGRVKPGWPHRVHIEEPRSDIRSLTMSPDGRLYVATGTCASPRNAMLLALDPDGQIPD